MIKTIHIATAIISISLFCLRMFWVVKKPEMMESKWVKIVPHVNDTVLLVMAIMLAMAYQQYPFIHHWLTAKVIALLLYIVLGTFALKRAKELKHKLIFFVLAVMTFAYIVIVAETKMVLGWW